MNNTKPIVASEVPGKNVVVDFVPEAQAAPEQVMALPAMIRQMSNTAVLEVEFLERDENQPRKDFDKKELEQLADSIQTHGLINPILVRQKENAPGRFIVVAGERRWQASKLAKLPTINALVLDRDLNDHERRALQFAENKDRSNLSLVEEGLFFKEEMEARGCSVKHLAEALHIDRTYVNLRLKMLTLPEDVQEKLRNHNVGPVAAYYLAKIEDEDDLRTTMDGLIDGSITPTSLREGNANGKTKKSSGANKNKKRTINSISITISSPKRVTYAQWKEALLKFIKEEIDEDGRTKKAAA